MRRPLLVLLSTSLLAACLSEVEVDDPFAGPGRASDARSSIAATDPPPGSDPSGSPATGAESTASPPAPSSGGPSSAPTSGAPPGTPSSTGPGVVTGEPAEPGELVAVSHERELRGIWIATAWAINFPSAAGRAPAQLREELSRLVDVSAEAGFNAIFFQVRPEGDAFFRSSHDPWSRFLSGRQGDDPGIDPLEELIALAHPRGIEVHAWLNPYRARVSASSALASSHMASRYPQYAYPYGNGTWMDPAAEPVQQRLLDVITELVTGYDVDGIHFDDYFYPYPVQGVPFPDDDTFAAYQASGGTLSLADWRRENVHTMVQRVHERILELDSSVRFGISPFGIYRPGQPPGITGLDAYASLYADPVRWMEEGWVDYVAPQLYWPTTRTAQAYEPLLTWWTGVHVELHVFAGNYLSQLGSDSDWTIDEFREQLRISRSMRHRNSRGNIWYQIGPLLEDRQGILAVFRDEFHPEPALSPPLVAARQREVLPPLLEGGDGQPYTITHRDARPLRGATVYRDEGDDDWVLVDILGPSADRFDPGPGRWALATVSRDGVESPGVVIAVP
ncbi:MAG: hypothetical protein EA398_12320 [Deltaproteobacteria bacterium]|nr:MAG: hypothetical protein EA398_12320 [Deltaproteobacteria bacterium]